MFFGMKQTPKHPTFEEWLNENGYFYIKTDKNKPCFKSTLTKKLKQRYNLEKSLKS